MLGGALLGRLAGEPDPQRGRRVVRRALVLDGATRVEDQGAGAVPRDEVVVEEAGLGMLLGVVPLLPRDGLIAELVKKAAPVLDIRKIRAGNALTIYSDSASSAPRFLVYEKDPIELLFRFALGWLDHEGPGYRPRHGGSVKAVIDQALGNIAHVDPGALLEGAKVEDAFVGHHPG